MKEKWYFTFMTRQTLLANKFVVFEGTFGEARQQMIENFGEKFAFQYSEKEFAGQVEKLGLVQLV